MYDENKNYMGEENNEIERPVEGAAESINAEVVGKPAKKKRKAGKVLLMTGICLSAAAATFVMSFFTVTMLADRRDAHFSIGTTRDEIVATDVERTDQTLLNYSILDKLDGEMSVENIVEACLPSVVSITNRGVSEVMTFFGNYQTESISSGSGIIIGQNEKELLIVTNYHVVAGTKELTVVFSHDEAATLAGDESYIKKAYVKGYDEDKDIAVIAVDLSELDKETMSKIKIAAIGNSDDIKMGSGVVAIGNALGYGQSVTHGIVSAVDREIVTQSAGGREIANKYIQTDAAINSGNSGGALLNMKGELIGINTAKIAATGVEGMGYAIPITDVEALINELMTIKPKDVVAENERGYLGIYGQDVSKIYAPDSSLPSGVYVQEVIENSPAERHGILAGDIITRVDAVSVSSMNALSERLSYYRAGETVTITVSRSRGGKYIEKEIDVKLSSKENAGIS